MTSSNMGSKMSDKKVPTPPESPEQASKTSALLEEDQPLLQPTAKQDVYVQPTSDTSSSAEEAKTTSLQDQLLSKTAECRKMRDQNTKVQDDLETALKSERLAHSRSIGIVRETRELISESRRDVEGILSRHGLSQQGIQRLEHEIQRLKHDSELAHNDIDMLLDQLEDMHNRTAKEKREKDKLTEELERMVSHAKKEKREKEKWIREFEQEKKISMVYLFFGIVCLFLVLAVLSGNVG
ncbi:hypothetical protein VTL71DRAFT_11395 [Oculimacula yallundae]|uniref:Uncharacterized protein n=1 Tax=Oculimacula yallundae TaxID=86028 RepID=A0ABR4CPY0_9HELO